MTFAPSKWSIIRKAFLVWLIFLGLFVLTVISANISAKEKIFGIVLLIMGGIIIPFVVILFMKKMFKRRGITKFDSSADI